MKNYEAFCAFIGGIGCLLFAIFIAVTFFTSIPEVRISIYDMVDFTLGLSIMGFYGLYLAWNYSKMYKIILASIGSISCLLGSLFVAANFFTSPPEIRFPVFYAFDCVFALAILGCFGLCMVWDYYRS